MRFLILVSCLLAASSVAAAEFELNGQKFTVPDGFQIEQIAGPSLVKRPVSADFDERGRLYVTDSSGSNEPVAVQRKKRPHRIVRLEDVDGDGRFDKSTVYADKLMFPEGALWFEGSLYVAAPPEIWKFTDADDDGVAERREVWFDGKTLTHCANDLHGPYLGPDGWMYWCKGAFAEQTYPRPGKTPLKTRAAHIFRRRPEGGPIEVVMTGGMDNPVEVVFTGGGERIFTTTFLVHPTHGRRDGLIHAVYGGVYGKDHGALDNHPRTGQLLPALDHLGAAAPCGLVKLESNALGRGFRNNILASSFNLHKITRHALDEKGATFASRTSDLLASNSLDFHPTDVLEDADGSIIVVDTGGWFRLCCPTSQLEKADVLGGIYRLRKSAAKPPADPRGQRINWANLDDKQLAGMLNDDRFAVRQQALRRLGRRRPYAIEALKQVLTSSRNNDHRLQAVWALTRMDDPRARAAVRGALRDTDTTVRQAALHSVSVRADKAAADQVAALIHNSAASAHNRRAAAEALGRIGSSSDVAKLLSAVPNAVYAHGNQEKVVDRFLEHSLIYAAMELNHPAGLRASLSSPNDRVRRAALIALDQLEGGDHLLASDIEPLLVSDNQLLKETAWWIAQQHADWGQMVVKAFRNELNKPPTEEKLLQELAERLGRFSHAKPVQEVMGRVLQGKATHKPVRLMIMKSMAASRQKPLPPTWSEPLLAQLSAANELTRAALTVLNQLSAGKLNKKTVARLERIVADERQDAEIRLRSLNLLPRAARRITPATLEFVCSQLVADTTVTNRSLGVNFLTTTPLTSQQLQRVARQLPRTGTMELRPLMAVFSKSKDPLVGKSLLSALLNAPAATSLFPDRLKELLSGFGASVVSEAKPLLVKIEEENQNKLQRVEEILSLLPQADARRGLHVFQSAKASCIACHRRGYIGGNIGPDLNRIGRIRSERVLLESILFPSLSFVRSYEPMAVVTDDGRVWNGLIRDESATTLTLQLDAKKSLQISKKAIEKRRLGTVSIMPAGLEKLLTPQDLADLLKYLKAD